MKRNVISIQLSFFFLPHAFELITIARLHDFGIFSMENILLSDTFILGYSSLESEQREV